MITDRQARIAAGKSQDNFRTPVNKQELNYWLANMREHEFTLPEMARATGLAREALQDALQRLPQDSADPARDSAGLLSVLPYPGGRHPRIGFLDGAVRPQRETKFSVFAPWQDGGYVVADIPEAIWMEQGSEPQLLYLAHTHAPTLWTRQGRDLAPLEWQRLPQGVLQIERQLPNGVAFGARVEPKTDAVLTELWLRNGTDQVLRGLRVQNCVMLKAAAGFNELTVENKRLQNPYVACRNAAGDRWIITAWERCVRPWANRHCPCMHSDPQFADCAPGETQRIRGWLSFYEGTQIESELQRIAQLGWQQQP